MSWKKARGPANEQEQTRFLLSTVETETLTGNHTSENAITKEDNASKKTKIPCSRALTWSGRKCAQSSSP